MFFRGGHHSGMNNRRRTRRGKDVIHKIRVTLEDLYVGKKQKISLLNPVLYLVSGFS